MACLAPHVLGRGPSSASLVAPFSQVSAPLTPVALTTNGSVSGVVQDDVAGFLGIPFAAPPTGTRRFLPPAAHPGWNGTRAAVLRGHSCLQADFLGSEDCLFINVFTPLAQLPPVAQGTRGAAVSGSGAGVEALTRQQPRSVAANAPLRPVMFYIHGGGFVSGSASDNIWNFTRLTGHVLFATQYRLGALGFLTTGQNSSAPPENLGLADQRFALQWVRENARAFGGDPEQIMIFGCSAGGASVAGMLTMPTAFGMYKAAGIESPGMLHLTDVGASKFTFIRCLFFHRICLSLVLVSLCSSLACDGRVIGVSFSNRKGGHQGWMGGTTRPDDDWMSPGLNRNNSHQLALELGCQSAGNLTCLQSADIKQLLPASQKLRFAPAMGDEGVFPLGLIRQGKWNKVGGEQVMVVTFQCDCLLVHTIGYHASPPVFRSL